MTKARYVFITAFAVLVSALSAHAEKMHRIGYLHPGNPGSSSTKAFVQQLRKLGYEDGHNITIDFRFAKSQKKLLPAMAAELVGLKPDVIVVCCQPAVNAVRKATTTIPIVVGVSANYVKQGLVESLQRPGGNLTGSTSMSGEFIGKQIRIFKEAVPTLTRVAVLHMGSKSHRAFLKRAEAEAGKLGFKLVPVAVKSPDEFTTAFQRIEKAGVDGFFVLRGGLLHRNKKRTTEFATKARLPSMYGHWQEAVAGGMIAYGIDTRQLFRNAAQFVDKILKGASPAELPVAKPTEIDFVVNMKTAKSLGITVPQAILKRATKVIE